MPQTDIGSTAVGSSTIESYTVDTASTDGAADQKETRWTNTEYSQNLGYYKNIPELMAVIDAKARWTVGKGFSSDEGTEMILDTLKGYKKDTFNTIIENLARTMHISGDSYAEIIRNDKGYLINLKPLDPGAMTHIANREGLLIKYEFRKTKQNKAKPKILQPEDVFHLTRNRIADEIHGTSMVPVLKDIILMKNEAMQDWKKVLHRNVYPQIVWHLDTDNETEIASFKAKRENANKDQEELFIPKGAVEREVGGVAPNATLNPLAWIELLDDKFYQAAGVPKIILGGTGAITEAAVKIAYLAFQQTIEEEQLFLEEQILAQLNLVVKFQFPASLENEMLSDKPKEEEEVNNPEIEQANNAIEPNDTTTEMEGRK